MRVYVAGAWTERHERAAPMVVRLCKAGLSITYDWATVVENEKVKCSDCSGSGRAPLDTCTTANGCFISFACPRCVGLGIAPPKDADRSPEYRRKHARAELIGVRDADIVWLMAGNSDGAVGSWVELGAALAYHREIVVSGKNRNRTIFTELALQRFETDEEAFEWIVKQ